MRRIAFLSISICIASPVFAQFTPPSNANANGSNPSAGQTPSPFPQLQNNPFGNSGFQNSSTGGPLGVPASAAKPTSSITPLQAQPKSQPVSSAFFPQITAHPVGNVLVPLAMPSSVSGGGGIGAFRPVSAGTYYSPAPTYTPPAAPKPAPSAVSPKPSSSVTPTPPVNAQKVNPTYVAPNPNASAAPSSSGGIGGNPNMTPQACVATGTCK